MSYFTAVTQQYLITFSGGLTTRPGTAQADVISALCFVQQQCVNLGSINLVWLQYCEKEGTGDLM